MGKNNTIEVYGAVISFPEQPTLGEIDGYNLPVTEQIWRRSELPQFFEKVEFNKNGDLILSDEQEKYAREEVRRCKQGYWFMCNGEATYITGKNYFYLQWYKLEDDIYADYRANDRKYFLFLNYWERKKFCLGIVRTKKRREGASSQACSNLIYEAIFFKNSNCGLISKTKDDSKDTFRDMVTFAYKQLPIFLKPKQVNKEDSVTELVFAHKSQSQKTSSANTIETDVGHQSKINYRAPVLNAYDRGRLSRLLIDEGAKFPKETPTSQLLAIVSKTMVKGVERVGFTEAPSTVNEMTKSGGAEFYKIWRYADQFKGVPTTNRFARYFSPAYEGFPGFIGMYGESVIDEPTEDQFNYLSKKWVEYDPDTGERTSELSDEDIRMGARYYVQIKRRVGLEGIALEEETRMNPCDEDEAFLSAVSDCVFSALNIKKRQKELEDNPVHKRHIIFERQLDQIVRPRDAGPNDKYYWQITQLPPDGQTNKSTTIDGQKRPARTRDGVITVDSYSNTQGGRKYGSKASAWIGRRFNMLDPDNTGKPIGHLYGRPKDKDILHEQVMLAAEYYGYRIYYEHTADDYFGYFKDRSKLGYLARYPKRLLDPTKKEAERHRGTPITPFSLTRQLDDGISYFNHHCHSIDYPELLDNALIFEADNRTEFDCVVSFLMLISCMMEPDDVMPPRKEPLVKVYSQQAETNWN